jgi:hypothetical protein
MSINAHESEMILMIQSTSTNDVDKDCKGWFYQLTHHFLLEEELAIVVGRGHVEKQILILTCPVCETF